MLRMCWYKFVTVMILVILQSYCFANGVNEKIFEAEWAINNSWEYSRENFNSAVNLGEDLSELLSVYQKLSEVEKTVSAVTLLVALNCAIRPSNYTTAHVLYYYRCKNGSFETFSDLILPGELFYLRFVRTEDISRSKRYIENYIDFVGNIDCDLSVCPSEASVTEMREILDYLRSGGFDVNNKTN